jgi:hypothetical protein
MAVAHDASSESHTVTTGSVSEASFTWNHTPTGAPAGALVFVFNLTSTTDTVTSVTYGDRTMNAVSGGRAVDTANEPGSCKAYFLSGVPSSTQAVVVNRTNNTDVMYATVQTFTALTEVATAGVVLVQENVTIAVQSVDDGSPGTNSVRYAGGFSGLQTPPTAGSGSTLDQQIDTGAVCAQCAHETTAGAGARNVGFTSVTSDDAAYVHLAVIEAPMKPGAGSLGVTALSAPTVSIESGAVVVIPGKILFRNRVYA